MYNYILKVKYLDKNNNIKSLILNCNENLNLNSIIYFLNRKYNIKDIKISYEIIDYKYKYFIKFMIGYIITFIIFMIGLFLCYP